MTFFIPRGRIGNRGMEDVILVRKADFNPSFFLDKCFKTVQTCLEALIKENRRIREAFFPKKTSLIPVVHIPTRV